jgi:hypothetical protein
MSFRSIKTLLILPLVVISALLVGVLAFAGSASAWTIQSSPNPKAATDFAGVSCPSTSTCVTVGAGRDPGASIFSLLSDVLQSGTWSAHYPPEPTSETFFKGSLEAVSCSSGTSCEAVGDSYFSGYKLVAERWNGTEWTLQTLPEPSEAKSLTGVDCLSSNFCEAVGYTANTSFAESWNGTEWKLQSVPNPEGSESSRAYGVSCASVEHCVLAGEEVSTGVGQTMTEVWNGVEWKAQTTPNPKEDKSALLLGVSCSSGTECEAVGSYDSSTGVTTMLAERWNGTEWALQTVPKPVGVEAASLKSVACVSSGSCEAASRGASSNFAEGWNGKEWSVQNMPSSVNGAEGISCASSTFCYAVSEFGIAAKWNGAEWATESIPGAPETIGSNFQDDSCTANAVCQAFGNYVAGNKMRLVLADQLDTTSWAQDILSNADWYGGADTSNSFQGLSCIEKTICVGVGYYTTSSGTETAMAEAKPLPLSEDFKKKTTPIPTGAKASSLQDVSCPTEELYCEGVGSYKSSAGTTTLFAVGPATIKEVTEGWQLQAPPAPEGAKASSLLGVSCATTKSCEAVGEYTSSTGVETPFAEQWNGSKWTVQKAAVPSGATASSLVRVSCTSSTSCEAVGSYKNSSATQVVLAEAWNGTEWTIQTTSNPSGAKASALHSVSCVSSSFCVAVGSYTNSSGVEVTLEEGWNGTKWEIHTTPNPEGAKASILRGVSCISSTDCEAVGDYVDSAGVEETLAEKGS